MVRLGGLLMLQPTRLLAVSSLDTSLMFWRRLALARLLRTISAAALCAVAERVSPLLLQSQPLICESPHALVTLKNINGHLARWQIKQFRLTPRLA